MTVIGNDEPRHPARPTDFAGVPALAHPVPALHPDPARGRPKGCPVRSVTA